MSEELEAQPERRADLKLLRQLLWDVAALGIGPAFKDAIDEIAAWRAWADARKKEDK